MKRHVLMYGVLGGVLIALLRWSEYHFLVVEHSLAIYGGLVAAIFAGIGIWLGMRLTDRRQKFPLSEPIQELPVPAVGSFVADESHRERLGITRRELEVLELIAQGMSTREMAERLFVSENTVKTHSSRVLGKLGAKRRTQAVQMGKECGLIA